MEVTATAKNIRISPQKVRLVVDEIKKMKPQEAIEILAHVNKRAALPLKKVMASAIANAKHNFGIDSQTLVIKSISVGNGRMLKRFRPVSRGRAHGILRKTSHITVVLEGQESKTNKPNTLDKSDKKEEAGGYNGPKS